MHRRIVNAGNACLEANVTQERKAFKYALFSQNTDIFLKLFLFIIGGVSLIKREISVGEFTVLYTYFGILSDDFSYFVNVSQEAYQYKAFMNRLKEIDALEEEGCGEKKLDAIDSIEVEGLDFGYTHEDKLYRDYNKIFKKGKLYCLKGDNGAGKSTLVKNILGLFVDVTGRCISYDGNKLCSINIYDARERLVGVCEQEQDMLDDTLRNNLLYCENEFIDMEKFRGICESLSLFQNVNSKIAFEDAMNRNALELSGGQKQKFAIARAIYKEPSVLILDEPSASLDKSSVEQLKTLLQKLKNDKIVIMITHDPKLIEIADEVINIA